MPILKLTDREISYVDRLTCADGIYSVRTVNRCFGISIDTVNDMRLLNEVKILRERFPNLKIRQLLDEYNRKYALFILPDCTENMRLTFEHDCMILDFHGCRTIYGYPEREFRYMIKEIGDLLENRTLAVTVEAEGRICGSMIISAGDICSEFLLSAAKSLCRVGGIRNPKNIFLNMYYCDSSLDRTEYFSELKI